jgi:LysM repeat protein
VRAPLEGVQESGVSPTEDASPRSSERHRPKEVTEIDLYPDNAKGPSRSKNIMLIGLVACLLLILSFGYSYRTNKELFRHIHQLEGEMQKVPTPPPTDRGAELQDIRDAILTLNQKTDAALQINRKRETDAEAISRRIDRLDQQISKIQEQVVKLDERLAEPMKSEEKISAEPITKSQEGNRVHVVRPGENLFRISLKYNIKLNKLAEYNNMNVNDTIDVGQKIKIPR